MAINNDFNTTLERLKRIGHRHVIGEDLKAIQEGFGLTMLDASYLMGCHSSRYFEMTSSKNAGEKISPVNRCLFVRLIHDWSAWGIHFPPSKRWHQWPLMMQQQPDPCEFEQVFRDHLLTIQKRWPTFSAVHMGVLVGLSGYRTLERWTIHGHSPNPISNRLMMYLILDVESRGTTAIEDHLERVETESSVRGHSDITEVIRNSRWNSIKQGRSRAEDD